LKHNSERQERLKPFKRLKRINPQALNLDQSSLVSRFMRYVQVDTQSDPRSTTSPSTEKQKDLSRMLTDELKAIGVDEVEMDDYGYVYALIRSNSSKQNTPAICFCSHVDTAPDCSGTNVKPILHENYSGDDIVLPDDPSQILRVADQPYLHSQIGQSIITASGGTLLGADDKAGVAIIMHAAEYLVRNPDVLHGDVR
jgi:tripeptide aminopeptidase